jgi:hypothetical protein
MKHIKDHLSNVIWLMNRHGAKLKTRKHKKYPCIVYGTDEFGRKVKMGGKRDWLGDELIKNYNDYLESRDSNFPSIS